LHPRERLTVLVIGDLLMAIVACGMALYFWASGERFLGFSMAFLQERVPGWFYFLPFLWLVLLVELYDIHRAGDWGDTVRGVALAAILGLGLYLLLFFFYTDPPLIAARRERF
jgi:hypothetical protein